MARVLSFRVGGLGGREKDCAFVLNRHVNVFCGINGSGKTTLLKILHSALSADASILTGLPFTSAEVEVHLNRHDAAFRRTYRPPERKKRKTEAGSQSERPSGQLYRAVFEAPPRPSRHGEWTSEPEEPDDARLTAYRAGYLPITRLYRSVGDQRSEVRTMSEEELDDRFAKEIQRLWVGYHAEVSNLTSTAQEVGLSNILHLVLSDEEPPPDEEGAPDAEQAYARLAAFLGRQARFADVLDSPDEFKKKYEKNPQVRSIVKQIDKVERRIEQVSAPRNRLKQLLESMYSGNKRIVLGEREIRVEISERGGIGLPSLSSGEKQLFFIALVALQSGSSSLIIDEPELSMHVDWQKKLILCLRELNPRMQLIMATHSPEITADLPDSSIFYL